MTQMDLLRRLRAMRGASGSDGEALDAAITHIQQMDAQIAQLKGLASRPYRRSSEKIPAGQMAMDFICHVLAQGKGETKPPDPPPKPPPRKKRSSKVHALSVVREDKKLPLEQRQCGTCGACKQAIGSEVTRRIVFTPAKLFMLEEHREKYACRPCGDGVTISPATPKLVEGSLASSSLLAHLTVAKVLDSTPVERIGRQLARHGAEIAPSTLNDWFGYAGAAAQMIQPRIREALHAGQLISLDDTPLPAKNNDHPRNIQRGRLWLYLADVDRVAYCAFTPDWKGKHPQEVLAGFGGAVQNDGYAGISALFGRGPAPPQRVGCNDHARRKFVEALKLGDSRAKLVVDLYAQIYAVERHATAAGATAVERLLLRQQESGPLWRQLSDVVDGLATTANKKGPLGKAVTYWVNQRATLEAFLASGSLPISNAHVERLLRTVALMRKNALFVGSLEAGERYAALLTMALNCLLCDANPFEYFTWLFDRLAEGWPAKRALDLLPQAWLANLKNP